jgi:hypothetical protein
MAAVTFPTAEGAAQAHGTQTAAGENPWLSFFGPPAGSLATTAYDKYAEQTFDLPEAYRGKNLFLRDTVDGLITDGSKPQWYTTVCLPWAQTDQITFQWNEFRFNETLAGRVPHEGISRLVTSSRAARNEKSVRRGLAMILEHGFMNTQEGQEQYKMNLQGIAQCVQETANHDVMNALLTCNNYDREWEAKHGIRTDGVMRMVEQEVYNYAAVQKTPHGLDIITEQVKQRMRRYGVSPDLMIIPPRLAIYLTMVRPEKTQYFLAGPDGAKNVREGPEALTNYRGLRTFESRSFDVYNNEPPIDLALRNRQVGEYYIIPKGSNSIEIYNEETDNFETLSRSDLKDTTFPATANGAKWWQSFPIEAAATGYTEKTFNQLVSATNELHGIIAVELGEDHRGRMCINHVNGAHPSTHPIVDPAVSTGVYNPHHSARSSNSSSNCTNYDAQIEHSRSKHCLVIEACKTMFNPLTDHTLQTKLNDAAGVDKLCVTTTSGYTGHPALHCSYRGLCVIEGDGTIEQKQVATPMRIAVDSIVNSGSAFQDECIRGHMPPNYTFTADGMTELQSVNNHAAKSYVFQVLMQTGCGHTLCPVSSEGKPDPMGAKLPGDTIVCHGLCRANFLESPQGQVGRLVLTNCSEGVKGASTHNLRGMHALSARKWALGEPARVVDFNYFLLASSIEDGQTSTAASPATQGTFMQMMNDQSETNKPSQTIDAADSLSYARSLIHRHRYLAANVVAHPRGIFGDTQVGTATFDNAGSYKISPDDAATRAGTPQLTVKGDDADALKFPVLIMRPFIEHAMYSMVIMKGGSDTGATYYGHNSVTVGDDAVSKMHYANFTFYQKALVRQPKNIFIAEDVFAAGYVGGCNLKCFETSQQIKDSLTGDVRGARGRHSIIAALLGTNEDVPNPMSITGRFTGAMAQGFGQKRKGEDSLEVHYSSCFAVNAVFGLQELLGFDKNVTNDTEFNGVTKHINTICFRGAYRVPRTGDQPRQVYHNSGHWGHTYAGVKAVRSGHNKFMREPGLEAVAAPMNTS